VTWTSTTAARWQFLVRVSRALERHPRRRQRALDRDVLRAAPPPTDRLKRVIQDKQNRRSQKSKAEASLLADGTAKEYDRLLAWYCVCLSACLWCCALWLNDTSHGKNVWEVNRKCPLGTQFYNIQPLPWPCPLKLPTPKIFADRTFAQYDRLLAPIRLPLRLWRCTTVCITTLGVGVWGWKLYHRVPRMALPIRFFRYFCCGMHRSVLTRRWLFQTCDIFGVLVNFCNYSVHVRRTQYGRPS